ncbi:hypothetical protein E3P86_03463 [Wallemia ichthyophaga]|uniref:Uncharacterized protein n=1 Tax=Wallemia ichthyophaga TaxID=245174 RepID=A0A4T0ITL2_WALIC|nr:hypothetical protein E3P86_03463 [Wallemia ichthyophaga]
MIAGISKQSILTFAILVLPALAPKLMAACRRLSEFHSIETFKRLETNKKSLKSLAIVASIILFNLLKAIKSALTSDNIFAKLPINVSQPLLENVYNPNNDVSLSTFFSRLNSFDLRLQYVRWGDRAARQCTWCSPQSGLDFALESFSGTFAPYVITFTALLFYIELQHKLHLGKPLFMLLSGAFLAHFIALVAYDTRPNPNFPPTILADVLKVLSYVFLTAMSSYTLSVKPNKYYSSPPDAINLLKPIVVPQKALLTSIKALNITNEARRTLNLNRKVPTERIKKSSDVATYQVIENEADRLIDAFGL